MAHFSKVQDFVYRAVLFEPLNAFHYVAGTFNCNAIQDLWNKIKFLCGINEKFGPSGLSLYLPWQLGLIWSKSFGSQHIGDRLFVTGANLYSNQIKKSVCFAMILLNKLFLFTDLFYLDFFLLIYCSNCLLLLCRFVLHIC